MDAPSPCQLQWGCPDTEGGPVVYPSGRVFFVAGEPSSLDRVHVERVVDARDVFKLVADVGDLEQCVEPPPRHPLGFQKAEGPDDRVQALGRSRDSRPEMPRVYGRRAACRGPMPDVSPVGRRLHIVGAYELGTSSCP
jgi:hypothetical protein